MDKEVLVKSYMSVTSRAPELQYLVIAEVGKKIRKRRPPTGRQPKEPAIT